MVNLILCDMLVEEVCVGESFFIVGVFYMIIGEYIEMFVFLVIGCDLIIIFFLMVNFIENVIIFEIICDGEFVMVGDSVYIVIGSYFMLLIIEVGCDFIVMLNFNVVFILIINLIEEICDGEFFMVGFDIYIIFGQYINVLILVVSGCDFIVNFDLIVYLLFVMIIMVEICEGEVYIIGGVDYNIIGMYEEVVLLMVIGCDLMIMFDLIVYLVYDEMMMVIICEGEFVMVGDSIYMEMGVWFIFMLMVEGCDFLVMFDLMVLLILEIDL